MAPPEDVVGEAVGADDLEELPVVLGAGVRLAFGVGVAAGAAGAAELDGDAPGAGDVGALAGGEADGLAADELDAD